jgi:hypothetical protein
MSFTPKRNEAPIVRAPPDEGGAASAWILLCMDRPVG